MVRRESVYISYYFMVQLRQIAGYWILGMVIGSLVSVFAKDTIHRAFDSIRDNDQFAEIVDRMKEADMIVIGSSVYWHNMSHFARMYGMEYIGMAVNDREAEKIAKKL